MIAGILPIRELNLSALFPSYTEIDVVPLQQHPYESILPIFGTLRGDALLRWSAVLGLVSGVLAVPLGLDSLALLQAITMLLEKPVTCLSYLFVFNKTTVISAHLH